MNASLQALVASLTIEQAREYTRQTDRLIWIETTLLDPANVSRRHAELVEDVLIDLLEVHAEK